jgi:hypothetical protein
VAPIASRLLLEAKECQSISIIDEGITTDTLELSPQTETERLHFKFGADLITARSKTEVEELRKSLREATKQLRTSGLQCQLRKLEKLVRECITEDALVEFSEGIIPPITDGLSAHRAPGSHEN